MPQLILFFRMAPWIAVLALMIYAGAESKRADKWKRQDAGHVAELTRISTAKDTQRVTTKKNIGQAVNHGLQAERRARVIEAAPLPGNCRTPDAVMSADL